MRTTDDRSDRRSAVVEVVVRLLDQVSSTALDSLETILVACLRESLPRRHHQHGRVVIYGTNHQVLRIREVPDAGTATPAAQPGGQASR